MAQNSSIIHMLFPNPTHLGQYFHILSDETVFFLIVVGAMLLFTKDDNQENNRINSRGPDITTDVE